MKKCPICAKFLSEVWDGWVCVCEYEDRMEPDVESPTHIVNREIHDNFWYGEEPTTEAAQEYCEFWHGGAE